MSKRAILLAGSAVLIAAPASALSDFRLPGTSAPTPTPPVVGPVDPERPAPRSTATRTPSPTPRPTVTATPTPTPAPAITLPAAQPRVRARPTPRPAQTDAAPRAVPTATQEEPANALPPPGDVPFAAPTFTPPPAASSAAEPAEDEGGLPWPWIAGFALLVALLAGGWWWLRQRMVPGGAPLVVPQIERPRVPVAEPEPEPAPEPAGQPDPALALATAAREAQAAHPLHILIQPIKLTQTVMNATLSYRLELTNAGEAPLAEVTVSADLVAAHASLPREALMADPQTDLPEHHRIASLAPGETAELKGELRLPLSRAMPIRQGSAVVFVPLARFRAAAEGTDPRCFTVVVGQPSSRGALQPHRLDLGPRSAEGLTGRAF